MKKVKIDILNNLDIPEGKSSTYFKDNTTKIKRILDKNDNKTYDHIFVGKNEFIIFLKNPIEVSDAMAIIPINKIGTYTKTTTKKISKSSDISTIIQD